MTSKGSDQTAMRMLILSFDVRTYNIVGNLILWLNYDSKVVNFD